jgi:hypothetical protein
VPQKVVIMKRNYHVVKTPSGWGVRKEGSSRLSATSTTQRGAIAKGRSMAINSRAELLIHGENGRIRERSSYGNDPFPPKG